MSIMVVLVGGMASAVLIASHALPDANDLSERKAAAVEAVERITRDLALATAFNSTAQRSVDFTVPDRGHGAAGPETMRYSWSATPGDPLTYRYNGSSDISVRENVHDFALTYARTIKPLTHTPRVLLLVANTGALTAQESARKSVMESWGFQVQPLSSTATAGALATAAQSTDVVYAPLGSPAALAALLSGLEIGVVVEDRLLVEALSLAKMANWNWAGSISILDNSHEITQTLGLGSLSILSAADYQTILQQSPAPGGRRLADGFGCAALLAVDLGGALYGGGAANGRRVVLPWGDKTFSFDKVNANGLIIMRRAIVWAAAPVVISSVQITVQVGPDASGRVVSEVQLLNLPETP